MNPSGLNFVSYDDILKKNYVTKTGMKKVTMIFKDSFSC